MNDLLEKPEGLIDAESLMRIDVKGTEIMKQAKELPLLWTFFALNAVAFLFGAGFEYEVIYRVFDYLAGDANEYWSPSLMAAGSFIILLGFHLLAAQRAGNFATALISFLARLLIPVYAIGAGLLFASILFEDGLGDMISASGPIVIGGDQSAAQGSWIADVFTQITEPVAVMAFALGIGSLAIINLFATHHWLTAIHAHARRIQQIKSDVKCFQQERDVIDACNEAYVENRFELGDLTFWDDERIALDTATLVQERFQQGLAPHWQVIKEDRYQGKPGTLELREGPNFDAVEKDLKRLDALSIASILKTLKPFIQ